MPPSYTGFTYSIVKERGSAPLSGELSPVVCFLEDGVSSLVVLLQQSASEAIGFVGYAIRFRYSTP